MDLDGRTRQFFSVLSERLKEKGFSSRIADDGCLAVKSKKMRGKEQTQCSVGKYTAAPWILRIFLGKETWNPYWKP